MELNQIESIIGNKLLIECPYMKLAPQLPSSSNRSHEGSGFISQDEKGSLSLKIYCKEKIDPMDALLPYGDTVAGIIIGEDSYYQLFFKDINGTEWESKWILPDIDPSPQFDEYVVKANIFEISNLSKIDKTVHQVDIYFPGKIRIPCNQVTEEEKFIDGEKTHSKGFNLTEFNFCGYNFKIKDENLWLKLSVSSVDNRIDDLRIIRFIESLEFVLARPLSWSISELIEGDERKTQIRSCRIDENKSRIGSPVYMDGPFSHAWSLFGRYLTHVINYDKENSWHPISTWIHAIIQSGTASLDAESLVISVAIEGVLREEFKDLGYRDPDLDAQIVKAKSIIEQSDLLDDFKKRLNGSLSAMSTPRAKDSLNILMERGLIEPVFVKIYDKLRNSFAHGELVNSHNLQEQLNRNGSALMLFYHLVFLTIGYKGKYIDYATHGFSVKEFNKSLTEICG